MRFIVYLSSCRGIITRATQSRVCNTRGETAGSDQSEPELEGDSKPHNAAVNETQLMLFLRLYKYKSNVNENMLHGHEGTWNYALLYMLFFLLPPRLLMVPSSQKATRCCIKMAASGRHVGQYFKRNGRLLTFNLEPSLSRRSFGWTSSRGQVAADANKESDENIILPRKKTWSQVAVLEALSSTVGRDPTMYNYRFQDDPFLSPRSFPESKLFSKAQESGKAAAKYFIDSHPKFFTKDFAEPHIPCLMPQTVSVRLEEVSEEALKERISLRKVSAATDMYDQLLQSGTNVSMETTHDLLDLICLYCDQEPGQEVEPQTEDVEPAEERPRVRGRQNRERPEFTWRENNNAERIFNLLPHRDTRCYSALIRGTVKHKAYTKAFSLYTDLLNERLTADVHIFNALILAVPLVREKYAERWELMEELLTQMNQQSVQPSLLTFNNILKSLRRCDSLARSKSLQILSEMKAVGLVPSLATYNHVLGIFYKTSFTAKKTNILQEILSELRGKQFTCQDPDDVHFFRTAMKICLDIKDLELGYEVQRLVEVGENWRLLGNDSQSTGYYGVFFNLLCMMENVDGVLKWYKHLVPSLFYLNSQATRSLFQALDTDSRLDLLPLIWKDMKSSGLDKFSDLVEDLLTLMAREEHSPEVQGQFAECALDIKAAFSRSHLTWSGSSLKNLTVLLLRANMIQGWNMLQLFKSTNRVPPENLLKDFLSVCQSHGSAPTAVELVKLSAAFCLPSTAQLANQTLATFDLTDEQRTLVSELCGGGESSD